MNKHFISDDLYRELQTLSEYVLISTAMFLREQWLDDPSNGEALMGILITEEVLTERGLELPALDHDPRLEHAVEHFCSVMNRQDNIIYH